MSTILQVPSLQERPQSDGRIWYQLHSEKEEICGALIREPGPAQPFRGVVGDIRDAEQLRQRLRLVVDALDRIMAGSYGNCTKCGRRIDDAKLVSDPAIAFCNQCAARMPTHH